MAKSFHLRSGHGDGFGQEGPNNTLGTSGWGGQTAVVAEEGVRGLGQQGTGTEAEQLGPVIWKFHSHEDNVHGTYWVSPARP